MSLSRYDIHLKINTHFIKFCNLGINRDKAELFYQYPWGSKLPTQIGPYVASDPDNGYLPDHTSFHKDGTVHVKARDQNKKSLYLNTQSHEDNFFNFPPGKCKSIFTSSLNISSKEIGLFKEKYEASEVSPNPKYFFDLGDIRHFTIALVAVCAKVDPRKIFTIEPYKHLKNLGIPICFESFTAQQIINNTEDSCSLGVNLVLFATSNVPSEYPKLDAPEGHPEIVEGIYTVTTPPNEHLQSLVPPSNGD